MADLRSDSPLCRRVVSAFLDFLGSVQPAPGVDLEGLDVVRDCLEEAFRLSKNSSDNEIRSGLLIDMFSKLETGEQSKLTSGAGPSGIKNASCVTSDSQQFDNSTDSKTKDHIGGPHVLGGESMDELFGNFFAALDRINFFNTAPDGVEDPAQTAKATQIFNDALTEMETSQGQMINLNSLAEMFKLRGNRFMQSKSYIEAIELYTCAIALCVRNAIYYCNRAAAFTQIEKYTEAIQDCLKSIEIDPNYSKAYSRLGLAYFAQGNYGDALVKGFFKALHLDPNNDSIKENIKVTQQKLREHYQAEADQNTGSNHRQDLPAQPGESTNQSTRGSFSFPIPPEFPNFFRTAPQSDNHHPSSSTFSASIPPEFTNMFTTASQAAGAANNGTPFPSFPFNASTPEFAEVFRNMASSAHGNQAHERTPTGSSEGGNEPDIRMDANVNIAFSEAPQQVSDVLRSVMGMLSQHGSQRDMPEGNDQA